jgi:hypothetical protein
MTIACSPYSLISPNRPSCLFVFLYLSKSLSTSLHSNSIVFDDTEDIFADKITQQALLALNEATAAIMVRVVQDTE